MEVSLPVAIIFTIFIIALIIFGKVRRVQRIRRHAPTGDDIKERLSEISDKVSDEIGDTMGAAASSQQSDEDPEDLLAPSENKKK